jgi:alpha/beta superfamily hydrolase
VTRNWVASREWTGTAVRREVGTFRSDHDDLYGSLYLPSASVRSPAGIVICGSWGVEGDRTQGMLRRLALGSAERGVAAMMFDYPGRGDSPGSASDITLAQLTRAAVAAAAHAARHHDAKWTFLGLRLGAIIAVRAAENGAPAGDGPDVLLVEPALDPAAFFDELMSAGRRASLGRVREPQRIFGYPIPAAIRAEPAVLDVAVDGALVRYAAETAAAGAGSLELIERPGGWHFTHSEHPQLETAVLDWLARDGRPQRGAAVSGGAGPQTPARWWRRRRVDSEPGRGGKPILRVSEHPVLVRTSAGPIGAMISEPPHDAVGSLFMLPGAGSIVATGTPGRAGPTGSTAKLMRQISELGIVTLRFDYPGVNESHMAERGDDTGDLTVPGELISWFHGETSGLPSLIGGICYGAQLAARLAAEVEPLTALAMFTPELYVVRSTADAVGMGSKGATAAGRADVDPRVISALTEILPRARVLAVGGDRERPGLTQLKADLGSQADRLEVDLMNGFQTKSPAADGYSERCDQLCRWLGAVVRSL